MQRKKRYQSENIEEVVQGRFLVAHSHLENVTFQQYQRLIELTFLEDGLIEKMYMDSRIDVVAAYIVKDNLNKMVLSEYGDFLLNTVGDCLDKSVLEYQIHDQLDDYICLHKDTIA